MSEGAANIGAELQRAREARGLALSEVAQQLKFAPRQLEALEQDRFDLLPGGTFVRGMVRNYARLLKIDPEPLVRSVGERFEAADARTLAERYQQPVPFSDSARRSTFVYLGLSLGVLALGAGVAWQWYHERAKGTAYARGEPPQQIAAPAAPAAKPKVAERGADKIAHAPPPAPPAVAAKAPDADGGAIEKVAIARLLPVAKVPPGLHRLVIRCEQEAWVEVRDDEDRALISSLNAAGAERALRARGPLNLVIGNARHVTILHNDQPLDLAPYIKTETARFTLP